MVYHCLLLPSKRGRAGRGERGRRERGGGRGRGERGRRERERGGGRGEGEGRMSLPSDLFPSSLTFVL
jgi:hypothetical protein